MAANLTLGSSLAIFMDLIVYLFAISMSLRILLVYLLFFFRRIRTFDVFYARFQVYTH